MALYDFLADGQADAGPRIFVARMQSLEHHKNPVCVLRVEANAVVANSKEPFFPAGLGPEMRG